MTVKAGFDKPLYEDRIKSVKFKSESGPSEADLATAITSHGDDMTNWLWDGPEDSDEEIEEMVEFKNAIEHEQGVKYSKNGIKDFIETILKTESCANTDDPATAKLWEKKLDTAGIKFYLKKGGSKWSSSQPYLRTESVFNHKFTMDKLAKVVSKL